MEFNCKDAAAELMKVASFSQANNVVFSGFVVFPSFAVNATTIPIILYVTCVHGKCLD